MPYWVYVDANDKVARVHQETCRYVRDRAQTLAPDNWWAVAFGTLDDAHRAADRMLPSPDRVIEDCRACAGD